MRLDPAAPAPRAPADERGFAFPLALLGLIVVSLLVTTALLTSSSEYAMSRAHADAATSLYAADGAAQQYLALKSSGAGLSPPTDSLAPVSGDARVAGYRITVTELQNSGFTRVGGTLVQDQTYSILSVPASGTGRRVSMLVRTRRSATPFRLNVTSGLTVGGNVKLTGSTVVSDGRDASCDSAAAASAVQVTAGASVVKTGAAKLVGTADTASFDKNALPGVVLGSLSLTQLAAMANVRFTAATFSGKPSSTSGGVPRTRTDKLNWGCPPGEACTSVAGNYSNTQYFPIVDIDAQGGTVGIQGTEGQGILIVRNGSLDITGNFVFHGIILVEKDLFVKGAGGTMKLEGAVVSFGKNSDVDDLASGNSVIRFDRCSVAAAEAGANQNLLTTAPQVIRGPPFGWREVIQ